MTSSSDDPESFQPHRTTKQQRKELASRMKEPMDELKVGDSSRYVAYRF